MTGPKLTGADLSGAVQVYAPLPVRVVFGAGSVGRVAAEAARLGANRPVVITTPGRSGVAERIAAQFAGGEAHVAPAARPNFPKSAFDKVMAVLSGRGGDGLVAVGGGTAIGLAKSVAAATRFPMIVVPTTYSGSEFQSNWYIDRGKNQRRGNEASALAKVVVYDPDLTVGLPGPLSAASGMNAMAHAVESLYGADVNPAVEVMAEAAIGLLARALPAIVADPGDRAARELALKGAWFAAGFRAQAGLEHAMAQRFRDAAGVGHAEAHAICLPYAAAFNAPAAQSAMARIARALGVADAPRGLHDLNRRLGLATGFAAHGVGRGALDAAVEAIAGAGMTHPRAVTRADIARLADAAVAGAPPEVF